MKAPFLVVLALLAASLALPAQARERKTNEERAIDLINAATSGVLGHPGCNRRPPESTVTHETPSDALLGMLGILRRPATAEDAVPADRTRSLPGSDVYIDYIRVAHAADGRSYWIVPVRDALHFDPLPQPCLHRVHLRLRRLSHGKPPRVRRRALHFFNSMVRSNRRLARRKPREGVFVFEKRADGLGGGGGGVDPTFIREHGMFGSSGNNERSAQVDGLIPDGVATVTSTFGRTYSRGPHRRPRTYRAAITRTDKVQDNIVSFRVARSAEDAFADKMVWRDADGKVVRVVQGRR